MANQVPLHEGVDKVLLARQAGSALRLALDSMQISNASIDRDRFHRVTIALSIDDTFHLASAIGQLHDVEDRVDAR